MVRPRGVNVDFLVDKAVEARRWRCRVRDRIGEDSVGCEGVVVFNDRVLVDDDIERVV